MSEGIAENGVRGLREAEWDLEPLLSGAIGADGPARTEHLLASAVTRADAFAAAQRGQIINLDADGLSNMVAELVAIKELAMRARSFARLWWAADTADPARGALMQLAQERVAEIDVKLLFFELEWITLSDDRADMLVEATREDPTVPSHHLGRLRDRRSHSLSEPEERILSEVRVTSREAWKRQYAELQSAVRVEVDGEHVPVDTALAKLQDPDRTVRRETSEALAAALSESMPAKAFVFNTLLYEKSVEDRLRSYPHWLAHRNLTNEASDESVEALIDAVLGATGIARRWYQLKAKLLGLDRLADYDRFAPIFADDTLVGYEDARGLVVDTYARFSPEAGRIVRRFFDERWIDAPPRPGKTGGAFCHDGSPSVHPYVLLNFTGTRADVLYMAHELGHGLHAVLAGPRGVFEFEPALTTAETASVFGETLVLERMLAEADDRGRLSLLALRLDNMIQTLFEAIAAYRFEDRAHRRRARGELSVQDLTAAWVESQTEVYGDSFDTTFNQAMWAYYPHFAIYPGYVYAYAFGQLLALSAFSRYREGGSGFATALVEMLAAGGSKSPQQLAAIIDVDLTDPGFWDAGLVLVNEQLQAAEDLAEALGPGQDLNSNL
jgi:oligoendopeptidase F